MIVLIRRSKQLTADKDSIEYDQEIPQSQTADKTVSSGLWHIMV